MHATKALDAVPPATTLAPALVEHTRTCMHVCARLHTQRTFSSKALARASTSALAALAASMASMTVVVSFLRAAELSARSSFTYGVGRRGVRPCMRVHQGEGAPRSSGRSGCMLNCGMGCGLFNIKSSTSRDVQQR